MKEIFSVIVFVLIAFPFVYMAFDVTRDITQKIKYFWVEKGHSFLQVLTQFINN